MTTSPRRKVLSARSSGTGEAILEVLQPLSETLTTEVMSELNAKVSSEGLPPEDVASDYLTEEGFIE